MTRIRPQGNDFAFALPDSYNLPKPMPLILLLLCILVRFPFYFPSVIDWDESTFILMGQSLLDGDLPYVKLWDNKPPLAFAFFAPVILFGKSIVTVRLAGTICVLISSYLTYRIGRHLWNQQAGFLAAIFSIIFVSTTSSGQATMTEIIALVPMMGALLILLNGASNPFSLFSTGCLLSIATLIRTNLGYLALVVGFLIVCSKISNGFVSLLKRTGAYVLGGLLPLTLVFLPYVITHNESIFVNAVFLAPLIYVRSISSPAEVLSILMEGFGLSNVLLWVGFLGGLALIAGFWKRYDREKRHQTILIAVFFLSVAWSIMSSGSAHGHYLIQLIPFMSLVAGFFFGFLPRYISTTPLLILILIGLALPTKPVLDQYVSIAEKLAANQPLQSDSGYQIASYILARNTSGEPVYMMTNHIVYWLIGMQPIAKSVTHPSTIGKEYLLKVFLGPHASTESELADLFAKRPLFIVKTKDTWYLQSKAAKVLEDLLNTDYELVKLIDGRYIYKRVQS